MSEPEMQPSGRKRLISRWRVWVTGLAVLAFAVLIFQNRHMVETRIFLVPVTMPHAVLIFVSAAAGFGLGILWSWTRRR